MGRKKSNSLQEEETLAEEVRKYRCLYDKSEEGYRDRTKNRNAWSAVDDTLGAEKGESQKSFENLKKRYHKKRNQLKKAKRSGAGKADIDRFEKQLNEYSFLFWLNPYIRLRSNTKTNLPTGNNVDSSEESDDTRDEVDNFDDVLLSPLDEDEAEEESKESILEERKEMQNQSVKRQKPQKRKRAEATSTEEEKKENDILLAIQERLRDRSSSAQKEKTDEDIFGEMVASELKSLPKKLRHRLKHDINNSIFKYHDMLAEEQDVCDHPFLKANNQSIPLNSTASSASNIPHYGSSSTQGNENGSIARPWYTSLTKFNELTQ